MEELLQRRTRRDRSLSGSWCSPERDCAASIRGLRSHLVKRRSAHEIYQVGRDVFRRSDGKDFLSLQQLQRNVFPRGYRVSTFRFMQDDRVGTVEELTRRSLEIRGIEVEDWDVKIGAQELHHTIRLDDDVFSIAQTRSNVGHRLRKPSLFCSHPQRTRSSSNKKTGSIGIACTALLFADSLRMFVSRAVARFAIDRADAVPKLRDLHRRPLIFPERSDQSGDHAGLAQVARVSADNDHCHDDYFFFARRASVANSFRYSRMGRAGVPQKTTPLPRMTLLLGTPHCAPRITPSSMRTWSAMPTCPAMITSLSMTTLPEIPV